MYICICFNPGIHMRVYIYIHTHSYTHTYTLTYIYIYVYRQNHTDTNTFCMCVYACVYIYICIYTQYYHALGPCSVQHDHLLKILRGPWTRWILVLRRNFVLASDGTSTLDQAKSVRVRGLLARTDTPPTDLTKTLPSSCVENFCWL